MKFLILHITSTKQSMYSETSIYRSRIIRFPGSVIQFLWSLSESYFNYGYRIYCFPGSIVSFSDPRRKRWIEVSLYTSSRFTRKLMRFNDFTVVELGAGIVQSVWRLATGWTTTRSEFESQESQEISFLQSIQTGSGAHPYQMDMRGSFPWGKRPGREADHSPQTSAEVKKTWIYTYTPPYAFMA
jgi:hypothetical protein